MRRFEGRTAIVTGAGGGIGRAVCVRLAGEGARVLCMDIAETRGETARLAAEAGAPTKAGASPEAGAAAGGAAEPLPLDVTDPEGVKTAFAEAAARHGPIDVLVNCVGGGQPLPALEIGEADFERMFDLNVKSVYRCCWAVLP
ncbi:MAG: SDR family NAD(P)-dependent oxidoreductase, partial [bacterium]